MTEFIKNLLCVKDFAKVISLFYPFNSNEVFSIIPTSQMKKYISYRLR